MTILKNTVVRNTLYALAVPLFGFVLWNLTFILYALLANGIMRFLPPDSFFGIHIWVRGFVQVVFVVIIGLTSWLILRSKLSDLVKAIWLTVPSAVILAFLGMYTYARPALTYGLGAFIVAAVLVCLRRTGKSWVYYYAVLFTAVTLTVFTLTGGEI